MENMDFLVTNHDGTISGNCFGNALNSDKGDLILSLKDNPMFQLSLASKELFHSNFLLWLAQDPELKGFFESLIRKLIRDDTFDFPTKYIARREDKNFDFCLRKYKQKAPNDKKEATNYVIGSDMEYVTDNQLGTYFFVLENKFKSIATANQLQGYSQKIKDCNKDEYCKCILLTLAENFSEKNSLPEEWKVQTYAYYAQILSELLETHNCISEKKKEYILDYINFIRNFSTILNKKLKTILDCSEVKNIYSPNEFSTIRCNDIWQKVALHTVLQKLKNRIEKDFTIDLNGNYKHLQEKSNSNGPVPQKYVALEVSMSHATGMLAVRRLLQKDYFIEVELQGNALCWGIGFYPGQRPNYVADKQNIEWENNARKCLAALPKPTNINELGTLLNGNDIRRYQNRDDSGYYYKKMDVSNKTIEEVIGYIYELVTIDISGHKDITKIQ